jgi:hypothetical protein
MLSHTFHGISPLLIHNSPDQCYPGASKLNVSFITSINTVTDIYLMAIPLPVCTNHFKPTSHARTANISRQIIYKAHLDLKKKMSLMILFSGGWIVIIFGILRCVTLVTVRARSPSSSLPSSFHAFLQH